MTKLRNLQADPGFGVGGRNFRQKVVSQQNAKPGGQEIKSSGSPFLWFRHTLVYAEPFVFDLSFSS